jgi:hypothetical protein
MPLPGARSEPAELAEIARLGRPPGTWTDLDPLIGTYWSPPEVRRGSAPCVAHR